MSPTKHQLSDLKIDRGEAPAAPSRRWLAIPALFLLMVAVLLGWWWTRPSSVRVRTAVARGAGSGQSDTVLNASGYVTARRRATVSSKVTGKVLQILIEEGMVVEEGQVMARLDAANVEVNVSLAEAQLAAAKSARQETRVRLAEAQLELERTRKLVASQIASQAELDTDRAEADSLDARLLRQEQEVGVAERRVALWAQQLEDTVIRAPFAGVVVAKNAQPGEMISPNSAGGGFTRTGIGTVVDMSSLEIEVDVSESYINRVQPGQRVDAILDAYPEWRIPAQVIAIIPTADRQKATVEVRIGFDELDRRILPDMGVKVAFRDRQVHAADVAGAAETGRPPIVLIPRAAVREDAGQSVLLVVNDGRVERRAVRLGERRGADVEVLAGVANGERVVVEGPAQITDGDSVEEEGR